MDFYSLELPAIPAAVVLLAAGGLICFFGSKLFKVVLALVGFAAGAIAAGGFATLLVPDAKVVMLVAAVLAGALGAVLLVWAFNVGIFVVGAACGLVVSGLLRAWLSGPAEVVVVVVLVVVGGVLALKLQKVMLAVATAVIGAAAMVVAGLSAVIGGEPAMTLIKGMVGGGAMGNAGWIAAFGWVVLTAAGIGVQLGRKSKKTD